MKKITWSLPFALTLLGIVSTPTGAQPIYTPYAFTNFAGQPGGPGVADGAGSGARFKSPSATAVGGAGNVYVADQNNFTIRKITPAGVVTTLAGSPGQIGTADGVGSAARFGSVYGGPTGVSVDGATNIYVSDTANYTIRKIALVGTNWMVSTLAGSPGQSGTNDGTNSVARFTNPSGMATDGAGNIYVADEFAIRRVTPDGVVTTLAGSVAQAGTTDGTNGAARFGSTYFGAPKGVAVDTATNIYVADTPNSTIRQVSPIGTNWVVTTLSGIAGFGGYTDGTNQVAQFYNPYGIAVDNGGNIYVSDSPAETIRKIAFSGTNRVVTTLAGTATVFGSADGTGSAARFQTPEGASVDGAGNLYVADFGNNTIRKITPEGVVTTLAGEAGGPGTADGARNAAQFYIPHNVAVDKAGNVYVSDTQNHTIRKITPAGVVTTVAGTPGEPGYADGVGTAEAPQFNGPIGVAADTAGNLYVSDTGNQTIRKITPAGVVTTLAGQVGVTGHANGTGGSAQFHGPNGTAVDSAGNIYVADEGNRIIREITPGGAVSTLAGSPGLQGTNDGVGSAARFDQPVAVAVDSAANVYVADEGGDTIREITSGGVVTTLAGLGEQSGSNDGVGSAARFYNPDGVAVDAAGNVYVSDSGNQTIRMITPGGLVTTIAGSPLQSGSADGTNGTARFNAPRGIAVDSATNIYVADAVNSTIRKLVLEGTNCVVTTLAGTPGQLNGNVDATGGGARFHNLYDMTVDSAGNLYVADRANDDIRRITPAGVVTTIAGTPRLSGSADGTGAAAEFFNPEDLTVDDAGDIYMVEFGNNTVRKIAPNGTNWIVTTVAGCASCPVGTNDGTGMDARFNQPFGLARDPSGNLYVADTSSFTVRKITPSGTNWVVSTFAGAPGQQGAVDATGTAARLSDPISLAADESGNLYLVDGQAIREITPGAAVTTLAGCPPPGCVNSLGDADGVGSLARFDAPRGIAVDHAGNLYVADAGNDTIRKLVFDGTDWMVTTLGGVPGQATSADGVGSDARFNQPTGVAVDVAGNLYVADSQDNSITKGTAVLESALRFDTSAGSLIVTNGLLAMRVNGPAGTNVVVEASTNLLNWVPILTNGLPLDLSEPLSAGPYRFFRARLMQ
jgi:sugar lactone lactonase YvrE